MTGHVNIHFRCTASGCDCGEAIVAVQVVTRADGTVIYEHTNRCPKCAHKMSAHKMIDQPVTPRSKR